MFPYRYLTEILGTERSGHQRNLGTSWDTCHKPYQARVDHHCTSMMDFHLQAKQQGDPQKYWQPWFHFRILVNCCQSRQKLSCDVDRRKKACPEDD